MKRASTPVEAAVALIAALIFLDSCGELFAWLNSVQEILRSTSFAVHIESKSSQSLSVGQPVVPSPVYIVYLSPGLVLLSPVEVGCAGAEEAATIVLVEVTVTLPDVGEKENTGATEVVEGEAPTALEASIPTIAPFRH